MEEENNLNKEDNNSNVVYTVPNEPERENLLLKTHLLGHFGINAMETTLHNDNIKWLKMCDDIAKFLNSCQPCRLFSKGHTVYHPPKSITTDGIFDHIVMDLGSFNVTTPRGNNFILVIVDLFSLIVIFEPIKNKLAITVAKALLEVFTTFGFSMEKMIGIYSYRQFNSH
jgi:hypothetical protein